MAVLATAATGMTRVLLDFIGRYALTREIDDRHAGHMLRFAGQAEIATTPQGASYVETGKMTFPNGQAFQSERRYNWAMSDGPVWVTFDDGAAFHSFDPRTGGAASEHLCGDDMYRGGYDFGAWPRWSLTWVVAGPRKEYRSETLFTPID